MLKALNTILLGDVHGKEMRRLRPRLDAINALGDEMARLTEGDIRSRSLALRERAMRGEDLDDLLVEAFALAREACGRTVGLKPFDVQVLGAMVLHEGKVAEMKTGEGKTLVAVLPFYLNALTGKGAHLVTVNDYLARRDRDWMKPAYDLLGMSVGLIVHDLDNAERRQAYACDVTYGTNNEMGFDYLRDNMVVSLDDMVTRGYNYAIVDEVDSILIDEARTPLIISGPGTESTELYYRFAQIVRLLKENEDYTVDLKAHTVAPTEAGVAKVEKALGVQNLYADAKTDLSHYLMQALRAQALMKLDKDYVVKDGEVIIVDEFTGRLMFGRRYSDGLHQAIEAKEGVKIESENLTLATITFQNFFRMYKKLAGMTGTAATEEEEFRKIYGVPVVVIPTNKPMIREDLADLVYKTEEGKFKAIVEDIARRHEKGQPLLVGTISIEKSEHLSRLLDKRGIPHQVLNAKHHEKEAQIIAGAGQKGMVTISTNMAGRGTDIVLGEGVRELGGLHVLGTERHEARRIDNQLRGRSGRQGDPGSSQFYVSLEDDLMRIFGGENLQAMMDRLGLDDDEAIQHNFLSRSIERAQKKVESRNFDIRKQLLQYDDVMNTQREILYDERRQLLDPKVDIQEKVRNMIEAVVDRTSGLFADESQGGDEGWDPKPLLDYAETIFLEPEEIKADEIEDLEPEEIRDLFMEKALQTYEAKAAALGPEVMSGLERIIAIRVVDEKWVGHLQAMDDLREGITLRAYAQTDPLVAYKQEAFAMFQEMSDAIQEDIVRFVFKVNVVQVPAEAEEALAVGDGASDPVPLPAFGPPPFPGAVHEVHPEAPRAIGGGDRESAPKPVTVTKVGRNDPCPCGSGKKYKKCHGASAGA